MGACSQLGSPKCALGLCALFAASCEAFRTCLPNFPDSYSYFATRYFRGASYGRNSPNRSFALRRDFTWGDMVRHGNFRPQHCEAVCTIFAHFALRRAEKQIPSITPAECPIFGHVLAPFALRRSKCGPTFAQGLLVCLN
jgi:hypothetical protein